MTLQITPFISMFTDSLTGAAVVATTAPAPVAMAVLALAGLVTWRTAGIARRRSRPNLPAMDRRGVLHSPVLSIIFNPNESAAH